MKRTALLVLTMALALTLANTTAAFVGLLGYGSRSAEAAVAAGEGWAWGYNLYGQLGDGTTTNRPSPVQVSSLTGATDISGGGLHTLALMNDGTVQAWGRNVLGQVGDGTTTDRHSPVQLSGLTGTTDVEAAPSHSLALMGDGSVRAWGYNSSGQLGDGTTTSRSAPVQVSGLSGVVDLAGGFNHTLAVMGDGSVRAWGGNQFGQLGDGTVTYHSTPVQVSGLSGVLDVAAGNGHSLALMGDGSVRAWGDNQYGQLGDGTTMNRSTPVQVSGLSGIVDVETSFSHSLALKSDGTVWAWGGNSYGQLGDDTVVNRSTPVQVSGLSGAVDVSTGNGHSVALKGDGTVWAWGANPLGQLGDGTTTERHTPVQAAGLTGATDIESGGTYGFAINPASSQLTAKFTAKWLDQGRGDEVAFDAGGSGPQADIASYEWDFGDMGQGTMTGGTSRNPIYAYPEPGRYNVTLTVTGNDGSTATAQKRVVVDPVKTFAPAVYMHPQEKYFPGGTEEFLDNSQLRWDKPNSTAITCKDEILADSNGFPSPDVPRFSYAQLSGTGGATPYSRKIALYDPDEDWCYTTTKTAYSNSAPRIAKKEENDTNGFVLNLKGSDPDPRQTPLYKGDKALDAPVYTEYEPGRYIIYWFFYPYNGWTDPMSDGKVLKEYHEGDWEHITVKLNTNNDATRVAYYQHYCAAKEYTWGSSKVGKVGGTHPKVYSALGGHASFEDVGDGTPVSCWSKGSVLDKASAKGPRWDTWNNTVNARSKSWYGYGGNWGDRSALSTQGLLGKLDNYGPEGPGPIRSKSPDVVPAGW